MRFAVIGSGKVALEVCAHLLGLEGANVACAIADPRHETAQTSFAEFAESQRIPVLETTKLGDQAANLLQSQNLDYLISANNHFILKKVHLSSARRGTINFHNGPLPRYAGINPCSWALLNGEREYGVTWHFVDEGIDTGDIIRQDYFPVGPDETAIELIANCIDHGLGLFPLVARDLLNGNVQRRPQNLEDRSYFGIKDRPWDGIFPFWATQSELMRLSQALAFWPMPNLFYRPALHIIDFGPIFAERCEHRAEVTEKSVGETSWTDEGLSVAVDGGSALLTELSDDKGVPIDRARLPERAILSRK